MSFNFHFEEDNFDEFADKLKECDVEYVHPIVEHSWGQRVVRFYDPDKHIIEVGGELQDNEADEQGYLFDYKITMIVNDDGTLSFKSNREGEMTDLIGHLATAPCPFPSDVKLKKVDQSVIDAIEMPAEYSLP